jgi:hypothetical protein
MRTVQEYINTSLGHYLEEERLRRTRKHQHLEPLNLDPNLNAKDEPPAPEEKLDISYHFFGQKAISSMDNVLELMRLSKLRTWQQAQDMNQKPRFSPQAIETYANLSNYGHDVTVFMRRLRHLADPRFPAPDQPFPTHLDHLRSNQEDSLPELEESGGKKTTEAPTRPPRPSTPKPTSFRPILNLTTNEDNPAQRRPASNEAADLAYHLEARSVIAGFHDVVRTTLAHLDNDFGIKLPPLPDATAYHSIPLDTIPHAPDAEESEAGEENDQ